SDLLYPPRRRSPPAAAAAVTAREELRSPWRAWARGSGAPRPATAPRRRSRGPSGSGARTGCPSPPPPPRRRRRRRPPPPRRGPDPAGTISCSSSGPR
ncbi:Os08g0338600, partial [Oryza sativa Japonica Group]